MSAEGAYTLMIATDRRLLLVNGKKLLAAVPATHLQGAAVVKRNALSPWTIRIDLANGYQGLLEANRMSHPEEFVDAPNALAPR